LGPSVTVMCTLARSKIKENCKIVDTYKNSNEFNKALHNFTFDVACGGAIRHLADLGYTVEEISKKLDFPVSKAQIAQAVWTHYVKTGVVCTEDPSCATAKDKVTYVSCKGEYGRSYFKQVVEKQDEASDKKYIKCEFGKMLYKDKEGFLKKVANLEKRDRDYVQGLPWPLYPVWHIEDERMLRIGKELCEDI